MSILRKRISAILLSLAMVTAVALPTFADDTQSYTPMQISAESEAFPQAYSLSDRSYSGLFFFQLLLPNFPQCRRNLANRVPESKPGEILTFVFV